MSDLSFMTSAHVKATLEETSSLKSVSLSRTLSNVSTAVSCSNLDEESNSICGSSLETASQTICGVEQEEQLPAL